METPGFYPSPLYCPITTTPLGYVTSLQEPNKHLLHKWEVGGVEAALALLKPQGTNQVMQEQELAQTFLSIGEERVM